MRIMKRNTVRDYAAKHARPRAALAIWEQRTKDAEWQSPNDVTKDFKSAKVLNGERVRFEIGDNHRLIVAFHFSSQVAYIKFIGTHAEYDKIDALTVDLY
jgi:mRNA interferase HigB